MPGTHILIGWMIPQMYWKCHIIIIITWLAQVPPIWGSMAIMLV